MSIYLKSLFASQELTPAQQSELEAHTKEVESFLRQEFGQSPMIKIAGSVSKGTAIRESYDLDIVVYFPSSDTRTLKQIHDEVWKKLSAKYAIEARASALRIRGLTTNGNNHDYHIDVVPGKFIEDSKDVFLHVAYGDRERIQTNLKTHIEYITSSGCQDIIKLVKIWKVRNGLSLKTFILELFVINALRGYQNKSNLDLAFTKVIEALANSMRVELVDPANSANIVSQSLTPADKSAISARAQETLETIKKYSSDDKWKMVFKEVAPTVTPREPRLIAKAPAGQWNSQQS